MRKPTEIILIRHGQSEGNAEGRFGGHLEIPLSLHGRQEAVATARALQGDSLTAIYSSDLPRAVESAEPLAQLTGLKISKTTAFRERSVGVMEGLTFEEATNQHPEQYAALLRRDFEHVISGGESYRQLLDRAASKLDQIVAEHQGERVAIFSHAGTICVLALRFMGAFEVAVPMPVWITSANCGISRFQLYDDGRVLIITINDTRHLTGLRE